MEREYVAFISYRHAERDSAVAKALHTRIEQYKIPKGLDARGRRKLGLVFRDEEELHTASNLSAEIREALGKSEYLIVVCTENTAQSPWVPREISHFLETHDRQHVLTVLASGEPGQVFPRELTHVEKPDGTVEVIEPLALDIRAGSPGSMRRKLGKELPRLLSAMLGCPYDALVLREQRRKFRRWISLSALVLAVVLGFSSMLVVKNREIAGKNTELAQQKAQIQLRESELLTEDAREALDRGNFPEAIENAVAALPKPEDADRPYYAPAEGVLMDALNAFHTADDTEYLACVEMEQETPVADYAVSAAGDRAVTLDGYGMLRCFDTGSGKLCWQRQLSEQFSDGWDYTERVIATEDENGLVALYHGTLTGFHLETGEVRWERNVKDMREGYLFYQPETGTLAWCELTRGEGAHLRLVFLDTRTGSELGVAPLTEQAEDASAYMSYCLNTYDYSNPTGASFSDDGTRFAGAFTDRNFYLHFFLAEPGRGTGKILYSSEEPVKYTYRVIKTVLQEHCLLAAVEGMETGTAITLLKIDTRTGRLLCRWDVPEEETRYGTGSFAFLSESLAVVGAYDYMAVVDLNTGAQLDRVRLPGILRHMSMTEGKFVFSLTDGTCGLGWLMNDNTLTLSTDASLGVSAQVGEHESMEVWGGGIVQLYTENGSFSLGVSNLNGPGAVAVIPSAAKNTLRFFFPRVLESPVELETLELPWEDISSGYHCAMERRGDTLILGPIDYTDPETGEPGCRVLAMDARTLQLRRQLDLKAAPSSCEYRYLPDGSGWVIHIIHKEIYLLQGRNEKQVWVPAGEMGEGRSSFAYVSGGTELLTAWSDMETLTLWHNSGGREDIPLPEKLTYTREQAPDVARLLTAGENGFVLVGLSENGGLTYTGEMAAYDTARGTWTDLEGDIGLHTRLPFTLAKEKPLWAFADEQNMLRVYDLSRGTETACIPLDVPGASVTNMTFILDDTCILAATLENVVYIYDLATGELRYREQLQSSSFGLVAWEDPARQRLYLASDTLRTGINGFCLDLRSWTKLSDLRDAMYFDPDTGYLYCYSNLFLRERAFVYFRVPDTEQLVQMGIEQLN